MGARNVNSDEEDEYEEERDVQDEEVRDEAARDDEEDDEEDEEGQDEYEKDDFIVDDVEEEEVEDETKHASDEEAKARKKKRRKREAEELDEEDYALLDEAGHKYHRPSKSDKKKFKRLKKAGRTEADMRLGLSDDDEDEEGRRGRTAEEELKYSLFGDDEGALPEEVGEEDHEDEDDIGDEDEMADFIVDEEEMLDENGQLLRTKRPKKKKSARQAPGISSSALQEAQEIFGDVSQLLEDRRMRIYQAEKQEDEEDEYDYKSRGTSKKRLEKEFEPSVLEEKYMTENDDHIRETDVPERLQLVAEMIAPLPQDVAREAEWIYDRAFGRIAIPTRLEFQHIANMEKAEAIKQIANVIQLLHDQKVEVPFIGMYRKEMCKDLIHEEQDGTDADSADAKPTLRHYKMCKDLIHEEQDGTDADSADAKPTLRHYKALWSVQYWDRKWWLLQRRKAALKAAYEKRTRLEAQEGEFLDKLLQSLMDTPSELCIDDIDGKFNLHFPPDEVEVEEGQFKRPKRRSLYSVCRKHGLGNVTKHFGLSPEQFGENLQAMYKRHEVDDATSTPDEIASIHLAGEFSDILSVLRGARHMAAVEISAEPAVREFVRNTYVEKALVSVKPTPDGNRVIDTFHQYSDVKWLLNKPVNAFDDAQWLLIQKAEEEKLVEVTIGIPKDVLASLVQEFETLYLSDGVSRTAQLWNEQRKLILKDTLSSFLLPSMEKEVRVILTGRGKQWIGMQCANQLWTRVSVAPYPRPNLDQEDRVDDDGAPRVLACCWGPGKPATAFVMLDSTGEIVDTLHAGYLTLRSGSYEQQQRKKNDQQRLLQFMKDHQPHVVVLGGANLNCRYLKDDIFEVIFKIVEEHPRDLAEGIDMIQMVYGDETIPRLYEYSRVSEEQLQQQPGIVRRAVALGRYLQNPLAVVSSLCGPSKEILSLKLHPLQTFLTPDEIYEAMETVMVTVTNQVGVDVNMAASHDWLFAPLQFVAGLGPRKAAHIKRAIQGAGRVNSRKEMLTSLELMKRNVFINAAGFIRVRGTGQAASGNQVLDPLDDTRIHPESYELAKKMAEDAYCEEFGNNIDDEEALELAVDHVRENPRVLRNLHIGEYAKVVQDRGMVSGRKLETLQDIKQELQHGYQECRVKYRAPDTDEVFYMLTGETEESLSEGRIVQATVRKVQQNKVLCVLESGLLGIIQREDLSDDRDADPNEKVSENGILTCRIKEVHKAKFLLDLTSKGSDLRGEHWNDTRPKDQYYVQNPSFFQDEEEKSRKKLEEEKHKSFKPRMIVHPQFRNISLLEATQSLTDKEIGEVIIRPSGKGPSHLSMTLKFYHGVYTHIEIVEGGKDVKSMTSLLRLGKTLTIGDDTFEDLDEVIARYVDPLVSHWREMFRYRKFKPGAKDEVDNTLRAEKEATPGRVPYYFSVCYDHPGVFTLSYIRSVNVHHEYVSVSPKGFRFRQRYFENPDKLVAYFQKHFNDPVPEPPPRRAAAAIVPSAWGDSDPRKGSSRGGWDRGPRVSGWDLKGNTHSGDGRGGWDQGNANAGGNRRAWERGAQGGKGNDSGGWSGWSDASTGGWAQPAPQNNGWVGTQGANDGWGDANSRLAGSGDQGWGDAGASRGSGW